MLAACGDGDDRSAAPAPAPPPDPPTALASAGGAPVTAADGTRFAPDWLVRVAREPVITVFRTAGPLLAGGRLLVGSTAIGWAAIEPDTGAVAWRLPGEEFTYRMILDRKDPGLVELVGRCAHVETAYPRVSCSQWVRIADGRVVKDVVGRGYEAEEKLTDRPGVWIDGSDSMASIFHQRLELKPEDDYVRHHPPGRFVEKWGALGQTDPGSAQVVAIQVVPPAEAGGEIETTIRPMWFDRNTGEAAITGHATPGDGVVDADIAPAGVAAAIRFGSDLKRHQVVLWGPDGALRWRWDLPAPQQGRVDLSVAVGDQAVFVFYDGRDLARLPLESPTPAAGSADASRAVLENPTP